MINEFAHPLHDMYNDDWTLYRMHPVKGRQYFDYEYSSTWVVSTQDHSLMTPSDEEFIYLLTWAEPEYE